MTDKLKLAGLLIDIDNTMQTYTSETRNPVSYFEIPVTEMDRAVSFYEAVLSVSLERTVIDGHQMALFPADTNGPGATGALAEGDSYVPSRSGPRIYFLVQSTEHALGRAIANGGRVAYPITAVGDYWVAEFLDSEGNQIALSSTNPHTEALPANAP